MDLCNTTLLYVGLISTSVSIYQMLRGAAILFTGSFSVMFLRRRLYAYHWFSLLLLSLGILVVGLSSIRRSTLEQSNAFLGIIYILFAQIFNAAQLVLEEKIMIVCQITPLKAVSYEGIFGLMTVFFGMIILHLMIGISHPGEFFDVQSGWQQIINFRQIWLTGIASCICVPFFNFFALTFTRNVNSISRSTVDACRILFTWMVSLFLGWETFSWLQVIGFMILIFGTFIFNDVIQLPPCFILPKDFTAENQPLIEDH
ncbi:integral membrane protein [Gigaspora margarita]|uniref:Integral membrane protein n=1 Tax=Gigaspora margarita TaxID=4874 RepID=A0A8H4ELR9_GIGMA|nr:integral membrane protein [Gigaspora margarita]